jgi:hypothetical protein
MTKIQQQKSLPPAALSLSPQQTRRRKSASSPSVSVRATPKVTKIVTQQQDTVESDSGDTKPPSTRRWNDPGKLLFLLVAHSYLVMAGWNFLKTDSPVMPTIILFYAGAYLRLNLVPILPTLKDFIQEWIRQQRKGP